MSVCPLCGQKLHCECCLSRRSRGAGRRVSVQQTTSNNRTLSVLSLHHISLARTIRQVVVVSPRIYQHSTHRLVTFAHQWSSWSTWDLVAVTATLAVLLGPSVG